MLAGSSKAGNGNAEGRLSTKWQHSIVDLLFLFRGSHICEIEKDLYLLVPALSMGNIFEHHTAIGQVTIPCFD